MDILYHFHNFYFYATYIDNSYAFSLDNKIKSKTPERFDLIRVLWRLKCAYNANIIGAETDSVRTYASVTSPGYENIKIHFSMGGSRISCEFDLKI